MKNGIIILSLPFILSGLVSCGVGNAEKEKNWPQEQAVKDTAKTGPATAQNIHLNEQYCNSRYYFCIAYPSDIITLENESASGDGASFYVGNNLDFLSIFGRTNPDPAAGKFNMKTELHNEMAEFLKDSSRHHANVSYSTTGKDFYVFSGTKDGKIFYQKGIAKGEDIAIAIFQYEKEQKEKFDVIVTAMAKSFN